MNQINLSLNIEEVNTVLQLLGQLPIASNALPLLIKIRDQALPQVPEQKEAPKAE